MDTLPSPCVSLPLSPRTLRDWSCVTVQASCPRGVPHFPGTSPPPETLQRKHLCRPGLGPSSARLPPSLPLWLRGHVGQQVFSLRIPFLSECVPGNHRAEGPEVKPSRAGSPEGWGLPGV